MEILLSKLIALLLYPLGLLTCLTAAATILLFANKRRAARVFLMLALLVIFIGGNGLVAHTLIRSLEDDYPPVAVDDAPRADVIVVLGGGLGLPHPPRLYPDLNSSSDRLLQALRLYRAGKAERILITGGNVFPQPGLESEAFYARRLLGLWGVPESAVLTETKSRNTMQNAELTAPLLERNGWSQVLLVTSALHMSRAVLAFEHAGIDVTPMPTDFSAVQANAPEILAWIPSQGSMGGTTVAIHEYIGRLYYRLRL